MRVGYIIEYSKKKGIFETFEDRKKAFCTQEHLAYILQDKINYTIWNAHWTNYDEYQMNHPNEKLEELD